MNIHSRIYDFTGDNDALVPEVWAQEALMLLENQMVMGNLVHRDYSDAVARFGDTVNAHRPAERRPTRKTDDDDVSSSSTDTDNVPVVLNQHIYDSFIVKDGEESLSFKELAALHLTPTIMGMADMIDQILATQVYQFVGTNAVGKLDTDIGHSTLTAVRDRANSLRWPNQGRNLVIPSAMEMALLNTDLFVSAEKVGDDGSALREGSLGRKFGLNTFMDQNTPSVATGSTTVSGAIDNGSGYAAGAGTLTVDGFTGALTAGTWFTVAGDMTPQQVISTTEDSGGDTTEIVCYPGLLNAVADDAVITTYTPGAVNLGAGYASGYSKDLVVDGFSVAPKSGQLVSFGAGTSSGTQRYSSIYSKNSPSTTSLFLDRPLAAAQANDTAIGLGPAGNYGFALHRNAVAFVNRPLAAPQAGTGALSYVANYNGLSIRVVITYDGKAQGHRVTVDMLGGVATLDSRLAFPVYG